MIKKLVQVVWIVVIIILFVSAIFQNIRTQKFSSCNEQAFYFYNHQQYGKAIPCLKTLLIMEPDLKGVQSMIGYCFLKENYYKEAIQAYHKAIDDNAKRSEPPGYDTAENHYYLGEALLKSGDKAGARLEWQEAIKRTSDPRIISEAKTELK